MAARTPAVENQILFTPDVQTNSSVSPTSGNLLQLVQIFNDFLTNQPPRSKLRRMNARPASAGFNGSTLRLRFDQTAGEVLLAEFRLFNLSGGIAGHLFKKDFARTFVARQRLAKLSHFGFRAGKARLQLDDRRDDFTQPMVGQPDHRDLGDGRMGLQPLGDAQRRGALVVDAQAHGLESLQQHPGVEGGEGGPGVAHQRIDHAVEVGGAAEERAADPPALAVDVVPFPIDWNDLARFDALAAVVKAEAKRLNIKVECGIDWKKFPDAPHYQVPG